MELDDELDGVALEDGRDAEEHRDVHDAEAAQLHVVPDEAGRRADEDVVREALDDDEVVRDEPVPALDEGERALALADARVAEEERAEAADLEEDAVERRARRERLLEERREALDDDARHPRRREERDAAAGGRGA